MVLMTVGNSEGERRCDEKCYGATGGVCTCVCGGMNHGAGLKQAQKNTFDHAEGLLKRAVKNNPEMKAIIHDIQQSFFD